MKRVLTIGIIGFAVSSASIFAEEGATAPKGGEGKAGGRAPMSQPIVSALDANGDGSIDTDELGKAAESLKKLDKNADGKIASDEYRPPRPSFGGRDGGKDAKKEEGKEPKEGGKEGFKMPAPPMVSAIDANNDGTIDTDELGKAVESLKKLDKNGDGKITPDEYRPQRPGFGGHKDGGKNDASKKDDAVKE
ncbi:MAG: hypothetical protein A2X49_10420 [Lentisphaerae bacterium GWF2_52_8]|nr:MAG: hypothetical protein A2X49_10420 [Lentisphaerae bacterium GWF2_52_8]